MVKVLMTLIRYPKKKKKESLWYFSIKKKKPNPLNICDCTTVTTNAYL